jgi:hypothetical protein
MFKIETLSKHHGWTDDPSFLGHGATNEDNRWPTEGDAESACYELAAAGVVAPECLRVVPACFATPTYWPNATPFTK